MRIIKHNWTSSDATVETAQKKRKRERTSLKEGPKGRRKSKREREKREKKTRIKTGFAYRM